MNNITLKNDNTMPTGSWTWCSTTRWCPPLTRLRRTSSRSRRSAASGWRNWACSTWATPPSDRANVFANAIKHDYKSKNPTTRWSDIIVLK